MTREEIEKFIRNIVQDPAYGIQDAVARIADRWEEDNEIVREYSIADGRDSCTH